MAYHDKYFEASAWLVLGVDRFQKAKDTGADMGIAAGTANRATAIFQSANNIVKTIPADYAENYGKKVA